MGFPEGRGRLDPLYSGFEKHFSTGRVIARGVIFHVVLGPASSGGHPLLNIDGFEPIPQCVSSRLWP